MMEKYGWFCGERVDKSVKAGRVDVLATRNVILISNGSFAIVHDGNRNSGPRRCSLWRKNG